MNQNVDRLGTLVRRRRRLYRLTSAGATAVGVLLVVLGFGAFRASPPSTERLLPPPASSAIVIHPTLSNTASLSEGPSVDLANVTAPRSVPVPTRLIIPAIGVDTSVVPLGRNADGTAQVPSSTTYAGWYDLGPRPGQVGPAVILGHVDSYTGPGVFYRLRSLLPGDIVTVQSGHETLRFEVAELVTYEKDHFPTASVFGPAPDPELRLITCGGPFDAAIGRYEDNVVAYAVQIG
jgi:sortase (surface protein transpeptidase)